MERLLTADEVAEILQVTEGTIYTWVSRGKLPAQKINGALRFEKSSLQTWIKAQKREPAAPDRAAAVTP